MSSSSEHSNILIRLQNSFTSGKTRSYGWRIQQLQNIRSMVKDNEIMVIHATAMDLGNAKSTFESQVLELSIVYNEIDNAIANLKKWMNPVITGIPAAIAPSSSKYIYEPFGVCLIVGPYNYPILLSLLPMIGAVAAGNCIVLKPSEITLNCAEILKVLISKYLDNDCIQIVCGGVPIMQSLLNLSWDKIFFTGSERVGRIVLQAASRHLTPVTLELGGKSPVFIDESCNNLVLAANRVVGTKFANLGQTCIAPDYVLCHAKHYEEFLKLVSAAVDRFYGTDPSQSPDLARFPTEAYCQRCADFLLDSPGEVIKGGSVDVKSKFIPPTIIRDVRLDSKVMQEEIFGPILPVIKISSVEEGIKIVRAVKSNPLALYIFSGSKTVNDKLIEFIPSGGVLINDIMFQFTSHLIPFGGRGSSGQGTYRGFFSFECFSHRRSVVHKNAWSILDPPIRYPPFTKSGRDMIMTLIRLPCLPALSLPLPSTSFLITYSVVAVVGYLSGWLLSRVFPPHP